MSARTIARRVKRTIAEPAGPIYLKLPRGLRNIELALTQSASFIEGKIAHGYENTHDRGHAVVMRRAINAIRFLKGELAPLPEFVK